MENKKIKITVGVPNSNEYLHRRFVQSLMNLEYPTNAAIDFTMIFGYQLPFARNRIVKQALLNESDYLLFMDADMVFPQDMLLRLLKHNVKMVNALAFRRIKPHYPCIFKWNGEDKCYETMTFTKGLLEVDATGMAAHLIHTDVFKAMKQPWYYYRDHQFSSDLTFCENAKKLGFKILIDTDLKIGHIGEEIVVTEDFYLKDLAPEAKEEHKQNMRDFLEKQRVDFKENNPKNEKAFKKNKTKD